MGNMPYRNAQGHGFRSSVTMQKLGVAAYICSSQSYGVQRQMASQSKLASQPRGLCLSFDLHVCTRDASLAF